VHPRTAAECLAELQQFSDAPQRRAQAIAPAHSVAPAGSDQRFDPARRTRDQHVVTRLMPPPRSSDAAPT
jgi:hypothetical protein